MVGFFLLALILTSSEFVTSNIDVEGSENLKLIAANKSIQSHAEFLPSTNSITHSATSTTPSAKITTSHTTGNTTQHTHSMTTTPPANTTTSHTTGSTTQHANQTTYSPISNTTTNHTTGNTTQHIHSMTTTPPANTTSHTTGSTMQHANQTTHSPISNVTTNHTTGNTTQHTHSTATPANTTGNTTQHANQTTHSTVTSTPIYNTTNTTILITTETVGPTLSPKPSPPPVLNYSVTLLNSSTNCIQASMGLELVVQNSDKKMNYFNIEHYGTQSTGTCGEDKSNLNIIFNTGSIKFTFEKNKDSYYISEIEALFKAPSQGIVYHGKKPNQQLFKTQLGLSFKCASKQTVTLADNFQLWTVNTQLQAFNIKDNKFGQASECSDDHNTVAVAVGVTVVIVIILTLIIYGIYLKRKSDGYQRI
ncbi:lysosome-associated membrane glycoprotein 3 isoform X2 [Rhinatrema bivittatum]|uniref:lysosome-associated membrane glycoprotein 3 isoform X2 n=1 Tax=Rhinatrema bivittatum TaxID=194408 RepID=UPI00112AF695|nr:lysosome-associated membrane glycoprotein 3 isoform X2 [Rhinatrema bivittatum]